MQIYNLNCALELYLYDKILDSVKKILEYIHDVPDLYTYCNISMKNENI